MTRDEAKAYFDKLATDAGLDDTQRNALAAAWGNQKFAESVSDGFMLKSDYSRSKNEVAEEKRKAQEEYAKKYQELKQWKEGQIDPLLAQANSIYAEYQQYKQTYGDLNGNQPQHQNGKQGDMLTLEQFQKLMEKQTNELAGQTGRVIKSAVKISNDYHKRFGDYPDMDEFDNFFADKQKANPNLDLDTAYSLWIAPKAEELREKRFAEELKKAKEEGAKEAFTKMRVPIDNAPRELGPAWDPKRHELGKMTAEQLEDHAEAAFFDEWAKVGQETPSR